MNKKNLAPRILAVAIAGVLLPSAFVSGRAAYRLLTGVEYAQPLEKHRVIPPAIVHLQSGAAVPLGAMLADTSVIILFSTSCSSCFAEADAWEELAAESGANVAFVALAQNASLSQLESFTSRSGAVRYARIDESTRKRLQGVGLPTIYVLDEVKTVQFAAVGPTATEDLKRWFRD